MTTGNRRTTDRNLTVIQNSIQH